MGDYNTRKSFHTPDSFMDELDRRIELKTDDENQPRHKFLSLQDILLTEFEPEEWLVNKLIPKSGITVIGGLPATMKSYFTNYIAACIAQGKPVLDRYKTENVPILFIDKENKLQRIQKRFLKLGIDNVASQQIFFLDSNFLIGNENDLATVCAFIKDHKIGLTVIDTMVRIHTGNENDATEINKVFVGFKEMLLAGSAVLFLHHFNKRQVGQTTDVNDQLRGSGDILAMVDSHIALTKKENMIEVEQGKSRDEDAIPKFLMQASFDNGQTHFDYIKEVEDDNRIEAIMIGDRILGAMQTGGVTRKGLLNSMPDVGEMRLYRAMDQLKKEGKIVGYARKGSREIIYNINRQTII